MNEENVSETSSKVENESINIQQFRVIDLSMSLAVAVRLESNRIGVREGNE